MLAPKPMQESTTLVFRTIPKRACDNVRKSDVVLSGKQVVRSDIVSTARSDHN
jgi:hypothetical protein